MEPPYGEQYSQESNPREYMTMRDYRNLVWQNQQPWKRNPNPPRSMRDYRDHWMSAPSYMVPPQYISTPQPPQRPQLISPVEQAILDLTKLVGDVVEEQKKINAQLSQKIDTMENNVNKRIDGLQSEMEQYSISKLTNQFVHQEEENLEEECLIETILVEQDKLQPQEELKVESVEAPEELQEALESSAAVCLWEKKDAIPLLLAEESVEEHKENNLPLPPTDSVYILPLPAPQSQPKTPTANAQTTYNPLPVYILPAANSKPTTPAPKGKSNPSLHAMQNLKILVAYVHKFATTSKAQAAAYTAWHSGWFGCAFGFGAPEPRHF